MDSTRSGSVFSLSVNCIPLNGARADFIIAALAPSGIWAAVTAVLDDAFWIKPEETWLYSLPFRVGKGHFRRPIRQLLNFRHHRVPSTHRHVCEEDQKSHKGQTKKWQMLLSTRGPPPPKKPMMLGPTPPAATRRTSNVERGPGVGPVDGGELTAGDPLPFGKIPMILSLKLW